MSGFVDLIGWGWTIIWFVGLIATAILAGIGGAVLFGGFLGGIMSMVSGIMMILGYNEMLMQASTTNSNSIVDSVISNLGGDCPVIDAQTVSTPA